MLRTPRPRTGSVTCSASCSSTLDPAGRWALLLSRPGAHPTDELDRAWAGALYDTVRSRGIRHDAIHLATDTEIVPVPLDDVTGYLQAS